MTVRVVDRGASRLLRAVSERGPTVEVGVIGAKGDEPHTGAGDGGDVTVAQVAEWMEFGTPTIPARSWLRAAIDEFGPELERRISIESRAVISGQRTQEQALARVGVWIVGKIQERIARGIPPALAAGTIARKGSTTPLIDTGQLRSSITSRVVR